MPSAALPVGPPGTERQPTLAAHPDWPAAAATTRWAVLTLALPALADQFLQMLLLWSDFYLAGQLMPAPEESMAAVGMGGQLIHIIGVLFTAIGVGATAVVARCIGAGDRRGANRVARQAMTLGVLIGTVTAAAMFLLAPTILYGLGLRGRTLADAVTFVRIFMPGLCLGGLMFMGNACLRGAGDTLGALMAIGLANIVNILVAWTLCFGWLGFPALGLRGIAIGTLTAYLVGGLFMIYLVGSGRRGIRVRLRPVVFQWGHIRRMLRIGTFSGFESMMVVSATTVVAGIVTHLSTQDYAAYVAALRLEAASFLPGFAFAIAGGALVGQSLGAGRPDRAVRCGWWAYVWGGGLMTLMGLVFILWPEPLVRIFASRAAPEVAEKAARMLRICGFIQPALAGMMIFAGGLKGAGDTRYPAAITFSGVLLVRTPGAYLAAHRLGLGVLGVWWVMMGDLVLRGSLMCWRFIHGGWRKARV